jgi:hypothetical protein
MFSHKFQVLTAALMKVKLFWDMKSYQLVLIHHTAKNTYLYENFLVVTHLRAYYGTDLDPSSYTVWHFLQDFASL